MATNFPYVFPTVCLLPQLWMYSTSGKGIAFHGLPLIPALLGALLIQVQTSRIPRCCFILQNVIRCPLHWGGKMWAKTPIKSNVEILQKMCMRIIFSWHSLDVLDHLKAIYVCLAWLRLVWNVWGMTISDWVRLPFLSPSNWLFHFLKMSNISDSLTWNIWLNISSGKKMGLLSE